MNDHSADSPPPGPDWGVREFQDRIEEIYDIYPVLKEKSGGKAGVRIAAEDLAVPQADRFALVLREKDAGPVLAARLIG